MVEFDFDAVVVGAGAVGLACGYVLGQRGLTVAVLEKDAAIGQGVSSRNSEVVHGGLYYPSGSLKARLCVEGRRALYAFCDAHHVEYDRCGKLVVAESEADLARLDTIMAQAQTNDVEGMAVLTKAQALALEPELACVGALISPQSGVFESHAYMLALEGEIEASGGAVVLSTPFEGATPLEGGGFEVRAVAAGTGENAGITREVGLPIAEAVQAFGQGRYGVAVERLRTVRNRAARFGGSHAQRDIIDLTLIAAAGLAGETDLERALLAERAAALPLT